jgi:hypothetical protein
MDVLLQLSRSRLAPFWSAGARPCRRSCESSGSTQPASAGRVNSVTGWHSGAGHTAYADSLRDNHIRRVTWEW